MISLPRQPSLFARLHRNRSDRNLFSQSGITTGQPLFPARVLNNKPTQHKAFAHWQNATPFLAWFTGFTLAFAWLGWFFRNIF